MHRRRLRRTGHRHRDCVLAGAFTLLTLPAALPAYAAMTDVEARRLAQLSLEELMQLEITTVSGTATARMTAPAALTVIRAEDIRRAGHRSLPDALRMVPGMYVGRINSSSWVVGSRGLTSSALTANRYLVLIDGRVVHDPLLSTTFWDAIDLVVDDIDRIEVIRGPGATLWGANAMNGVISVITRDARDTIGTVAHAGYGNFERGFGGLRHGGETANGAYRIWMQYGRRDDFETAAGTSVEDRWSSLHGGFRLDKGDAAAIRYTLIGAAHTLPTAQYAVQDPVPGRHRQTATTRGHSRIDGAHLLLRAVHDDGLGGGWSAQAYHDRVRRDNVRLDLKRQSNDLDYRRWFRWGNRHEWVWGLQYDQTSDRIGSGPGITFDPDARTVETVNAFVQNTTTLLDGRLHAMLGSKFTHHDFVGWHAQPSARLWWTPHGAHTVWAAVSRPVRIPSRLEVDGALIFSYVDTGLAAGQPASGIVLPLSLTGDVELDVEKLTAYEFGYRVQIGERWAIDATAFAGDYDHLVSVPPGIFGSFNQAGSGSTLAADIAVSYRASQALRLESSYSWLRTRIDGPVLQFEETGTPRKSAHLRAYWDIGEDWELNGAFYRVGAIERLGIDAYERVDLGLAWRASPTLELALWGQNLADPSHPEASGAEVPRSVYAQLSVALR